MKQFVICTGLSMMLSSCGEKEETSQEDEDIVSDDASDSEEEDTNSVEEDTESDNEFSDEWAFVCDIIAEEKLVHELPASQEEAPQLILVPNSGESYSLTKEASSDGWFMLEIPSWMCDVEIYTPENVQIELESSPDWELGAVAEPIAECGDTEVNLHSWTFHAWGSYVVHIQATDETEFWLATRLVEVK